MLKRNPAAVFALLFVVAIGAVAADSPHYNTSAGPHRVLAIDQLVLHDAARNKDLPLKIYYPEGAGLFLGRIEMAAEMAVFCRPLDPSCWRGEVREWVKRSASKADIP